MELCPGTVLTILKLCKANFVKQKKLGTEIFNALQPGFYSKDDDCGISAVFRGNRNVGSFIQINYQEMDPLEVSIRIKEKVLPLLDRNKWNIMINAFKILIRESDIKGDTEVEMVNHFTKDEVLKRTEIVFHEFIAGILIYVVKYTDNLHKEASVKQIINDFDNITALDCDIQFIDSYSINSLESLGSVIDEAEYFNLLVENGGNCRLCGKPLNMNNSTLFQAHNGDKLIVCLDCYGKLASASEEEIAKYQKTSRQLEIKMKSRNNMASNHLRDDVRLIIEKISRLDFSTNTVPRIDPLTVSQKVKNLPLRREILHDVYDYYSYVDKIIQHEAAEGKLNVRALEKVIKRMYEDREENISESDVYNLLIELVYEQTGCISREACHIIISYFVQRCEVFE